MRHGSLFSGIGGFDLAAAWVGWSNVFQCEINDFCRTILKYHFPKTELYEDIKTTDFSKYRGAVDVISGGFPCQPFSVAGKRKGTADDRFLWSEMFRAIHDVQPSWVVAENVYGLLTQQSGLVFERVCADLETAGYEVQPFVIPACAVNAPHRRDRLWIVANRANTGIESVQRKRKNGICKFESIADSKSNGRRAGRTNREIEESNTTERTSIFSNINRFSKKQIVANSDCIGSKQSANKCKTVKFTQNIPNWREFPTQSPICRRDDGLPGLLDGITVPKWRRKSIEAYGNAIVPQVAYEIFKVINEIENS